MHSHERRRAVRALDQGNRDLVVVGALICRSRCSGRRLFDGQIRSSGMCFGPARAVALRLARGQIGYLNLRYPPFQLLLMPRIQSGDGAARTDAEDEEHEPFSHDLPSSLVTPSRALLNAPLPI